MMMQIKQQSPLLQHSWLMVWVSFFVQGISFGNQYLNSLFVQPFMDNFGASSASVLFLTSGLMGILAAVGAPIYGILIQRYSARLFMMIAIACVGLGYASLAYATQLWHLAVVYALLFSVGASAGTIACNTLISNWFLENRGRALGVSAAGVSMIGFVGPPIAMRLMKLFGLQNTFLLMSLIIFLFIPIVWWFVRDFPNEKDIYYSYSSMTRIARKSNITWEELLKNRRYWIIVALVGTFSMISFVLLMNLITIAIHSNISTDLAPYLVSCAAVFAITGKILFGAISDYLNQRVMVHVCNCILASVCILLMREGSYISLFVASAFLGLSIGASTLLTSILVGKNFEQSEFSTVLGAINPPMILLYGICLPLFGLSRDFFGSYFIGLSFFLGTLIICATITSHLPKKNGMMRLAPLPD